MSLRQSVPFLVNLLMATAAFAGGFQKTSVPAGARWVAYLDVPTLLATELGQHLLLQIDSQEGGGRLTAIQTVFNLDLRKDLKSLTLYGTDNRPEHNITLLDGGLDKNRIALLLETNDTYLKFDYGVHAIHSWMPNAQKGASKPADGDRRVFGVFHPRGLVVIGQDLAATKVAVEVLDGKRPCLAAPALLQAMQPKNPFSCLAAAADLPAEEAATRQGLLRQTRHVHLELGEVQGSLRATVTLQADSLKSAGQIFLLAQAIVTGAILQREQKPELARLAQSMKVTLDKDKVRLSFQHPTKECLTLIQNWRSYAQTAPQPSATPKR